MTSHVTATELKQRLALYLNKATRTPVIITQGGQESAVLLSHERYQELQALAWKIDCGQKVLWQRKSKAIWVQRPP
ncbi:MAG: type II toxin-antitoxin system Phd/YefM family antitoxin [Magnetococcales bacterium]|nr:type II toxin-antitoxin system Phd/YefM family antitoxin [Magnetococcales bacterium]